jgi:tight adherence protein B
VLADFGLAAAILAAAALLLAELRHWWRPAPPAGSLGRRYSSAGPNQGAPARRRLQLPPLQGYALLVGTGLGTLFGLTIANAWFGIVMGVLVCAIASVQLPRWRRRVVRNKARKELQTALPQLVVALNAGQSLSTALLKWPAAAGRAMGPGKWVLLPHIRRLRAELQRGATPEEALTALGDRLDLDEIRTLTHVVRLCRRRGGDLGQAVSRSAAMVTEALDVRAQMHTLTAGKRAEGLLLTFLPPVMLLILTLANPIYALPLVQTNPGRLILVVALLLEAACFSLSRWLLEDDL